MCCILIKVQQAIDTIIFFKSKPRTFDKQHYENRKIWLTFVVNLVLILSATLKTSRSAQERLLDFNQFIVGWRCEKPMASFSHLTFFHIGSTKVGRKSSYFILVHGGSWLNERFYFEIKNPPTSDNTTVDNLFRYLFYGKKVQVKRRPRTFVPARFSLKMTLNMVVGHKFIEGF